MPSEDLIFDGLNDAQKRAVTTIDGPLLIIAGPGTGKTLTIVRRIAYLIQQGVEPKHILAITFTNRAANEMKHRVDAMLGEKARGIFIGTFHLLGLEIIKSKKGGDFVIYSTDEQFELLKLVTKESIKKVRLISKKISNVKNYLDDCEKDIWDAYEAYQAALSQHKAYDFDDLIHIPIEILELDAETRVKYQERFQHIMVDEYQDINPAQAHLLKLLTGTINTICAVGDPDQAIYGFRGAEIQNILNFQKDFPGAATLMLTENYRSTGSILLAADSVVRHNLKRMDRKFVAARDIGEAITVISVPDERAEAAVIIEEIEARMGGTSHYQVTHSKKSSVHFERTFRFSDFGIIFRTNIQAKSLEEAFSASGIPYQIIGRRNSLQAQETDELLTYLRSLVHVDDKVESSFTDSQEAKLLGPSDFFSPKADAVTLMTLHMAKGLEFRVVFIAGCEKGLLPCTIFKDNLDFEEERRLFYVGMTRAKDELFVLYSRQRYLYGQKQAIAPSPYLDELPERIIQRIVMPDKVKEQKGQNRQLGLF